MFDLDKAIVSWRRSFRHRRVFLEDDLEELERHVRDHTAWLVEHGVSEKKAFEEAVRSVGDYGTVEAEYRKVFWGKLKQRRSLLRELTWRGIMLTNYLKIAFRNLRKYRGYAFINVSGLAVGIACCFLIFLYVQDERSYDRYHEHADAIYRVLLERPNQPSRARTQSLLAPFLQADYPFVEKGIRFSWPQVHFVTYEDRVFTEERVYYTDSTVFDLFSFSLIRGNPQTALLGPDALVITESAARKYFGTEDPIGKVLLFDQSREMVITAVAADVPSASHFVFDFLAPMSVYATLWGAGFEDWSTAEVYTYIQLPDARARAALESSFPDFIERYQGVEAVANQAYRLQRLTDIHLHSAGVSWEIVPQGDIRYVYVFSTIAVLILLIACINFINLSTARASKRSKEVGMRKVVGAHRSQLIQQFLSESFLISFLALLVGFVLIVLALPVLNELTGKTLGLSAIRAHWLGLLVLVLLVGLLAGSYPAFALSRFQPATVLKGALPGGLKKVSLRNGLVVFQFGITAILLFGSVVVYQQLNFMRTTDLGFEKAQILVVRVPGRLIGDYPVYRDAIAGHPGIASISASSHVPPATWGYPRLQPQGRDSTFSMKLFAVDYDFIEMMGMEMVAGRSFSRNFATDSSEALILNETAVRQLGWTNTSALGKRATVSWVNKDGTVIGVVKDFHFRSLRNRIQPAVFTIAPGFFWNVVVKVHPAHTSDVVARLEQAWQEIAPGWPFQYSFLDEQLREQYQTDEHLGRLVGYLTLLSIFLACLGLLGLAAFTIEQRTKEIGVRKVLGASVPGIVSLLSQDFGRLVLVALVLAVPLAYLAARRWLEEFVYRIEIGIGLFLLTGGLVLLLALLTVSYQTVRAAVADPVKTLRYE